MSTPLERLGEAIESFLKETEQLADGRFMTGWVMAASTAHLQTEDSGALPMVSGATYALGPETSTIQAAGLTKFLDVVLERTTWSMLTPDEDDD